MGGGLMQLVAMGAQDVYLTGNPQITFFKVVYRRHTNFSKECIAQQFNGQTSVGGTGTVTLSRNGDLIQEIYVRMPMTVAATKTGVDCSGLVKTVEVEIGGQKIDKHYAEWMNIYDDLFETNDKLIDVLHTATDGAGGAATVSNVYVPLRFWFNRNPGLALPLIALQYHEVKINVTWGDAINHHTMGSCDLLVNYLYLDTDERRRFAQVSHEYLIEQVQYTGAETKSKFSLNFNHPVKALLWTHQPSDLTKKIKLQLNGHDRAAEQGCEYYALVQPYENGLAHNDKTRERPVTTKSYNGLYSFCLKPAEHQPSGTCNFSRIDNATLDLGSITGSAHVFALNYNVLRIMSGMGGLAYSN